MASGKPEHLLILGVRHPDRNVYSEVKDYIEEDVDRIFHESPTGESSKLKYALWTVVKNPLAVVFGTLRLLVYITSNLWFAARYIAKGKASSLTLKRGGQAQGLRAAKSASKELDVEWESVDVTLVERAKLVPWKFSLASWFAVFALAVTIPMATTGSIPWMVGALGAVAFSTQIGSMLGDVRRPIRDRRMFENIRESCNENDSSEVVLITGENHVQGVASNAAAEDVDYDAFWISSTAAL